MAFFKQLLKGGKREAGEERRVEVASPLKGEVVPLESVGDPVFAEKTLGDGAAIVPADGKLYAPVDGVVSALFPTGHAMGITTEGGLELLIHIGIDTVDLKGEGFSVHTQQDAKVKQGQLLVTFDVKQIRAKGYDPTTMVLASNGGQFGQLHKKEAGETAVGDLLLWF